MGSVTLNVNVKAGGPLLDGRSAGFVDRWQRETVSELADMGVDKLKSFPMDKTGRARGGFQSLVKAYKDGATARIPGPQVTGVTWSPWLEGNSKRNRSTGFGGYRLFRKTARSLSARSKRVGEDVLRRLISEIGGG